MRMTRESLVFLFGVLIFLAPHLGIPAVWKFYVYTIGGIVLMLLGYSLRRSAYLRSIENDQGELETDSFAETVVVTEHDNDPEVIPE